MVKTEKERIATLLMSAEWRMKDGQRQWILGDTEYRALLEMTDWRVTKTREVLVAVGG